MNAIFEYTDFYFSNLYLKNTKISEFSENKKKKSVRKLESFLAKEIGTSVLKNEYNPKIFFQIAVVKRMKILLGGNLT